MSNVRLAASTSPRATIMRRVASHFVANLLVNGLYPIKEALYRICCGASRLGDSGVHTLGDNSAFVNPAGQLLLPGGVRPEWIPSAWYLNSIQPLFNWTGDISGAVDVCPTPRSLYNVLHTISYNHYMITMFPKD